MRPIFFVLMALFALLQYQLWFASGGVVSIYHLHKNIEKQQIVNQRLTSRNAVLMADIKDLKSGNEAIEERARDELGMVKKGEVFYQIVK